MLIMCPVDVKYKGVKHKAHNQFTCDSSDFQRLFKPLGAWAFVEPERKVKEITPKNIKETENA